MPAFLAPALLLFGGPLPGPGPSATAAPKAPAVLKGTVAPKQEVAWTVTVTAGKEARLHVVKGGREVNVDVLDPQGLAANEGVADGDPFPVVRGAYRVLIANTTALGAKAAGRPVAYEVRIEIR